MKIFFILVLNIFLISCQPNLLVFSGPSKQSTGKVPQIFSISRMTAKAGDEVPISGLNLSAGMTVIISQMIIPVKATSLSTGYFIMPDGVTDDLSTIRFLSKDNEDIGATSLLVSSNSKVLPVMTIDRALVCNGVQYLDANGNIKTGIRNCSGNNKACDKDGESDCTSTTDFPSISLGTLRSVQKDMRPEANLAGLSGLLDDCKSDGAINCFVPSSGYSAALTIGASTKILKGESVIGIAGAVLPRSANCSLDNAVGCVSTSTFRAARIGNISASDILTGHSILGLSGTAVAAPPLCSAEGQNGCTTHASYPAFITAGATAKVLDSQSLGGIIGTAPLPPINCSIDGQTSCVSVSNYPSVDKVNKLLPNASHFRQGLVLAGVAGTLSDCSADGESSCVVVGPLFAAGASSNTSAKIRSGQTVAGISGTAPLRPADCSADGATACVTVTNYPAVKMSTLLSNTSQYRSTINFAGVQGSMPLCSIDGDHNCLALSPAFAAVNLTGAGAKILSGQTFAGVPGSVAPKPADCLTDGQISCVATTFFPAALASAAASKIASGQILAGITGSNANIQPANCINDGELGCTTAANFPAMNANGAALKIALGESLGGVAGTASVRPSDCGNDGQVSCVSWYDFPAVMKSGVQSNANNFLSTFSILGVSGAINDCIADGALGCRSTTSYPSILALGAAGKVMVGQTLGGISGSSPLMPANCSLDNQTSCVTIPSYPSVNKSFVTSSVGGIKSNLSLININGTLVNCSADGATACTTTASYPAANVTSAATKILTGETLAGVAGSVAARPSDCSTDGEISCVVASPFKAAKVSGAAAKILTGQSIAGILGTAALRPSDCDTDGKISCVTTANFPSLDKSTKLSAANLLKIRSSLTIAGLSGNLPDCTSDGDSDCFIPGSNIRAASTSGAAAKILTGQILAGVSGAAAVRPTDCLSGGDVSCVTVNSYPSVDVASLASNANKLRTGTTIAGVAGTLNDCSADNATGCVTVLAYPAVVNSSLAGTVKNGNTLSGVMGAYPSASYPLTGSTSATDLTNFVSQMKSDSMFEFFDSSGNRYTGSGDSDLVPKYIRSGVVFENLSITGSLPATLPRTPSPLTELYSSAGPSITLNWQNTGAMGYLLVRRTKGVVDFTPVQNSIYSVGTQGNSTILYIGASTSYVDTTISTSNSYSYAVYAYDSNYFYSATPARASDMLNLCAAATNGGSWIAVPGNLYYGTSDFCVMKYPAKNVSNAAVSKAASTPWVNILFPSAVSECSSLGSKYSLISNPEYLTIGLNIASNSKNWSGGIVGSGAINRGHSDNNPTTPCAASSDDTLAWVQGNCTPLDSTGGFWSQKRTHVLTNGSVIWDFSGNVTTFISTLMNWTKKPYVSTDGNAVNSAREFNIVDRQFASMDRTALSPTHVASEFWDDNWNSAHGIGAYLAYSQGTGGVISRGGDLRIGASAGIFALNLQLDSSHFSDSAGFRCTYHP